MLFHPPAEPSIHDVRVCSDTRLNTPAINTTHETRHVCKRSRRARRNRGEPPLQLPPCRLCPLALLGLHLLQLLLLVHGNARADYGLDLARQDAVQREVRAKPVVGAPGGREAQGVCVPCARPAVRAYGTR